MILEIISFVLLLAILGVLFLVLKRVAAIESPQTTQVGQEASDTLPEEVSDFGAVRNAFIEYIENESCILQLDDFSKEEYGGQYIGYNCGYKTDSGHDIFLSAGLNFQKSLSDGIIAAGLVIRSTSGYVESHYKEMEAHKTEIENAFFLTGIEFKTIGRTHRMSMEKLHIDLSQSENWNAEFRWLRETLEKLYWVLRLQETLEWNHTLSESQSSPNYLEPFNLSGPEIRKRRIALGFTQVQVAKELGMKDGTSIGDWENERAKIPPRHHAKLLEILKLTPLP